MVLIKGSTHVAMIVDRTHEGWHKGMKLKLFKGECILTFIYTLGMGQ